MGLLDLWSSFFGTDKNKDIIKKAERKSPDKSATKRRVVITRKKKNKSENKPGNKSHRKTAEKRTIRTNNGKAQKKSIPNNTQKESKNEHSGIRIRNFRGLSGYAKRSNNKPGEKEIGTVTHYFGKISVGVIKLKYSLKRGDKIKIKGAHDDFTQVVSSMQIDRKNILSAGKGKEVGIKVLNPVHTNDKVYVIKE